MHPLELRKVGVLLDITAWKCPENYFECSSNSVNYKEKVVCIIIVVSIEEYVAMCCLHFLLFSAAVVNKVT